MTEYIILVRSSEGTANPNVDWTTVGRATARSAKAAIRERIDGTQQSSAHYGDGEYVAVPARSWQPVTVKSESVTKLKFS